MCVYFLNKNIFVKNGEMENIYILAIISAHCAGEKKLCHEYIINMTPFTITVIEFLNDSYYQDYIYCWVLLKTKGEMPLWSSI